MSFAQNSPNAQSPVDRGKIILKLLGDIDAAQGVLTKAEERERKLVEEIEKADEAHAELTEAHKKALLELGELRATIKFKKEEIEGLKQQVELWKGEAARLNKELKASRKRELILLLGHIARSVIGR